MIKKYILIMIMGAVVVGMAVSVSAEREEDLFEIQITAFEEGQEEPILISPGSDATITSDLEDEEHIADNTLEDGEELPLIAPNPNDNLTDDLLIAENEAGSREKASNTVESSGIQILGVVGIAIALATALIIINKKK